MRSQKRQKTEHFNSSDNHHLEEAWDGIESDADQLESDGFDRLSEDDLVGEQEVEESDVEFSGLEDNITTDGPPVSSIGHANEHQSKPPFTVNGTQLHGRTSRPKNLSLQVESLLGRLRPRRAQREIEVDAALHKIKKTVVNTQDQGPILVSKARNALNKKKIAIPFPDPQPEDDLQIKFNCLQPASVNVVGSYAMKTAESTRGCLYIDMVVQMPSAMFQPKDYLNHRYFYKRAYYLACLAAGIQKAHAQEFQLQFQRHHDDPLRPIIVIRPAAEVNGSDPESSSKWQISILPALSQDQFPANKLSPDRSCIRSADSDIASQPTPVYNSSLRADMLVTEYLRLLHRASSTCPAYKDACLLGNAWLRKRGFQATSRKGGFARFEWSTLLALLLTGGGSGGRPLLNQGFDSIQLFKAALRLLATRDLVKQPLIIAAEGSQTIMNKIGAPVVWDAVRSHNILYKMPSWAYRRIQTEAKTTLAMLDDPHFNGFEASFVQQKDHDLLEYDCAVILRGQDFPSDESRQTLYQDLKRGLTDRVSHINITADTLKPWDLGSARAELEISTNIRVSLSTNPDNVNRMVDHGPSVEDKVAATAFRKFWGDKAELRRFKDGSILEALIWDRVDKKNSILEQVLHHILRQRYGDEVEENAAIHTDRFAGLIGGHTLRSAFQSAGETFRKLENDIRSLQGVPLPIRHILPAGVRSNASDGARKSLFAPLDVVIQFESSGKWPDDLAAIQQTKIAFLLRIKELFDASLEHATCAVGLENPQDDILNQGFMDVAYETGATFRIRIFHDREQTLLERRLKDKTIDSRSTEISAIALAAYKRSFLVRPAHAQALAQFCSRHPALTGATMLLKKWIASHLLHNHIQDEVIELIAARTFVQSWPWNCPASVQTAFLRTIAWLATWDWRLEPLFVDFEAKKASNTAERTAMQTRFDAWRKLDPLMNRVTIFAASSVDTDGTTFTLDRPSKVVAGRMTALAKAASAEICSQGISLQAQSLFKSSLLDYDFVVHLDTRNLRNRPEPESEFKNVQLGMKTDATTIGFDPAADFLNELEDAYGAAVVSFSGLPEKGVIGGLWTPQTADRPWRVNLTYSTEPISSGDGPDAMGRLNKTAILAEMSRLGGDLISRIDVK